MLRFQQLHRKGGSKLLSKTIQHGGGIEPYIAGQTGTGIEPYIAGQTGIGRPKLSDEEKAKRKAERNAAKAEAVEVKVDGAPKLYSHAKRVEDYPDENVIYDDPNWKDIMIEKVATGMYCLENQPPEIKAAMKDDYDNTMEEYKGYLESDTTEDLERTYSTMADLFRNEDYKIFDIRKEVFKEKAKDGKKKGGPKEKDGRTSKEKRLDYRAKSIEFVNNIRNRFITKIKAIDNMRNEFFTQKTKNDLPIHYSILAGLPDKINERIATIPDFIKEFEEAYKSFLYHDDKVVKKKYGDRHKFNWVYEKSLNGMKKEYDRLSNPEYLNKPPQPKYEEKELEQKGEHPPDFGKDYVSKVVMHNEIKKKPNDDEDVKEDWHDKYVKLGEDLNRIVRGVVQVDDLIKMFKGTAGREKDVIKLQGDIVRMKEEYKTKLKEFKEVEQIMVDNKLGDKMKLLPFMDEAVKATKKEKEPEIVETVLNELDKCHEDNDSLIDKYNALVVKYKKLSAKNKKCKEELQAKKPEKVSKQQVKEEVKVELPKKDVVERGYDPKGKSKQHIYDEYVLVAKEMETLFNKIVKVQSKMNDKFEFEKDKAKLRKQYEALNELFDGKIQHYRDIEQYVIEKNLGAQYIWKDAKKKEKKKKGSNSVINALI
jgi:hypothetical protein